MSRGLRGIRRATLVLVAAWVLTLGISVGRYDEASVLGGSPEWESFKSGESPLYVGAIIKSGQERSFGVPYVFMFCSQTLDSADLLFSVGADANPGEIRFEVVGSELNNNGSVVFRRGVRTVSANWEKIRIGDTWVRRAQVPLGKTAIPHRDFLLSAKGYVQFVDSDRSELGFDMLRRIHVKRSYSVCPGWAFLLYFNHY